MFKFHRLWDAIDLSFGPDRESLDRVPAPSRGLEMPADLRAFLMQDFSETVPAATWVAQESLTGRCAR